MALASYYQIKAAEPAVRVFYILRSLHLWARTDSGVTPKRAFNNSTQIIKAITNKKNVHAPSKTPTRTSERKGRRGGLSDVVAASTPEEAVPPPPLEPPPSPMDVDERTPTTAEDAPGEEALGEGEAMSDVEATSTASTEEVIPPPPLESPPLHTVDIR